ncbi:MAG: pyruvate kinase [Candidatus Uhrbacteria bacterium]
MKRTKIVCTIGPASDTPATLSAMIKSGMNVARLNFSHGTHAGHAKLVRTIRATAKKAGETVAILGDLQGPKIRIGVVPDAGVVLRNGETVTLPVTYSALYKDVKRGDRVMIDDGIIEVSYVSGKAGFMTAKVVNGGTVTSHKGMNFPDSTLRVSSLTAKDKEDIIFGVQQGVDWMALSFVTSAKDVKTLRRLIAAASPSLNHSITQSLPKIIVKIEKHEALENFDEILAATDAVMVARGDLGVETPAEDVPLRQKEIVEKCRLAGKPVVVATQMLDSMTRNPRPTRAEVSDVANAVIDHADAVMLSGESATGKYPKQAVATMAKIIAETEASKFDDVAAEEIAGSGVGALSETLKAFVAGDLISGIVASHSFAPWAERLMIARPEVPLFLGCATEAEARQVGIRWGVRAFVLKSKSSVGFAEKAIAELRARKWVKKGAHLAVVTGDEKGAGFDVAVAR